MNVRVMAPLIVGLVFAVPAQATPLTPGNTVVPSAETAMAAGSYLVSPTTAPVTGVNALGQIRFTGSLTFAVYREGASGFLDFLYQYHATSSHDPLQRMSVTDFSASSTDVTHITTTAPSGFVLGTLAPSTVSRSPDGGVVSFSFPRPRSIGPGTTSQVMVIHTNATQIVLGTTNLIDGGIGTVVTRAPRGAPEPATLTLFGGGLLCIAGFVYRRRRQTAPKV